MGRQTVPQTYLELHDYKSDKQEFQAPCVISSVIFINILEFDSLDMISMYGSTEDWRVYPEYFSPYWYWNQSTSDKIFLPYTVEIISGDTTAQIYHSSKCLRECSTQSALQTLWTTPPIYATHSSGSGYDVIYYRQTPNPSKSRFRPYGVVVDIPWTQESSLRQLLPDIIIPNVSEPTKIKVSVTISGVYAESTVTILPAEKRDLHVNGQLLGIYPNDRTETIFTGFKGVMKKNQEVI